MVRRIALYVAGLTVALAAAGCEVYGGGPAVAVGVGPYYPGYYGYDYGFGYGGLYRPYYGYGYGHYGYGRYGYARGGLRGGGFHGGGRR